MYGHMVQNINCLNLFHSYYGNNRQFITLEKRIFCHLTAKTYRIFVSINETKYTAMNDSTQWTLPPARPEDYEGRDRHWTLRKTVLASAKNCDLFVESQNWLDMTSNEQ